MKRGQLLEFMPALTKCLMYNQRPMKVQPRLKMQTPISITGKQSVYAASSANASTQKGHVTRVLVFDLIIHYESNRHIINPTTRNKHSALDAHPPRTSEQHGQH